MCVHARGAATQLPAAAQAPAILGHPTNICCAGWHGWHIELRFLTGCGNDCALSPLLLLLLLPQAIMTAVHNGRRREQLLTSTNTDSNTAAVAMGGPNNCREHGRHVSDIYVRTACDLAG